MKYLLSFTIVLILTGCVAFNNTVKDRNDSFTIASNDKTISIETKDTKLYKVGGCLSKSMYYQDNSVQIEYISVKQRCTWTGLADGLYQDFLRKNIKGLEKTRTIKVDNGDIYKFQKDQQFFYLISLYDASSNTFIIDYTGKIASKILGKDFTIDKEMRLNPRLQKEFLENYQFKGYFESTNSEEDIIFP
jgi:hypothetical protein